MILLAVDTCLSACTAVVGRDGVLAAARCEPMQRGHQERLAPMVQEVMVEAGIGFAQLDRIAATVGPGSFTGLRVGLSFAKAMAAALGRPCVGIGSLEALAEGTPGRIVACADARHGQFYWQAFEDGAAVTEPALAHEVAPPWTPDTLTGPGAALLAERFPKAARLDLAAPTPEALMRLAGRSTAPARPLYLRKPDAKLPGGVEPAWLS